MSQAHVAPLSNTTDTVRELYIEADIDQLNAALRERGVAASDIIAIMQVPGQTMVRPTPPQFRVLYRV